MSHDSDCAQDGRAIKERRKEMRRLLGQACPRCAEARPKADPSILLPGQSCRVDGYRDPRQQGDSAQ